MSPARLYKKYYNFVKMTLSGNRPRKSRGTLQNKVRINVLPLQLFTFAPICSNVCGIQKYILQ